MLCFQLDSNGQPRTSWSALHALWAGLLVVVCQTAGLDSRQDHEDLTRAVQELERQGTVYTKDELAQIQKNAAIFLVQDHSVHRTAGKRTLALLVLDDGTVIAGADSRNRKCQIRLGMMELAELMQSLDEECQFFQVRADGSYFFELGDELPADWDREYNWIHVRDDDRSSTIGCGYGWVSGTADGIPSAPEFAATLQKLWSVVYLARAGGQANIEQLVTPANEALLKSRPDLAAISTDDFRYAEFDKDGNRRIVFKREDAAGKLRITVDISGNGSRQIEIRSGE